MIVRLRTIAILPGAATAAAGRKVAGGILIRDAAVYDALSHRLLLGPLFDRIAADIADVAPAGGRVLEVGCGPGPLSIRLVRLGLDVIGLDLDPAMIERARANANSSSDGRGASFLVGDVASMAFPDASFDLVVSALSMHHWNDPSAGWRRSIECYAREAERSCGTSAPAPCRSTSGCPIRSSRCAALRFASSGRRAGAGHGASASSSESNSRALTSAAQAKARSRIVDACSTRHRDTSRELHSATISRSSSGLRITRPGWRLDAIAARSVQRRSSL